MSVENFIFSGLGFVTGKHKVSNEAIDQFIDAGFLTGLDKSRIENSEKYIAAKAEQEDLSPFNYMADLLMGFRNRYHVVPFPPRKEHFKTAQNSLDLLVDAMQQAFDDSGVHPEDISAWIVGTATPQEMAPGIAETAKCYFTQKSNRSETMTTTSACVGYNINVERALNMFKAHPEMQHIMVAHTEVMSSLLLETDDFVPFTTFGDGAAATIISRVQGEEKEGIVDVLNYEDMAMIDFLGADRNGNLIMDPRRVKWRAVPNIARSATELLNKAAWQLDDMDLFIPHQTGNAIVHSAAKQLNVPLKKVYQDIQYTYGNLSGASVPAAFCQLKREGKIKPGQKIITAVTGLGGELGGFSYIGHAPYHFEPKNEELKGKTALVTGCTGGLGREVSLMLAAKGCRVLMHYNSNESKAKDLLQEMPHPELKHALLKANFADEQAVEDLIQEIKDSYPALDYLVHTAAVTGGLSKASEVNTEELETVEKVNYLHPAKLTEGLAFMLTDTVIFTGSIAQDAQFSGSSAYVSSKRALQAYAASFSRRLYPKLKVVFYIPAIIDGGMTETLNTEQIKASMQAVGQEKLIPLRDIAERIVKSLYITKVAQVRNEYHGVMIVRKDGYTKY